MTENTAIASSDDLAAIGYSGDCFIYSAGFEERDTQTWKLVFDWNAQGHIHFNETFASVDCPGPWDFL